MHYPTLNNYGQILNVPLMWYCSLS